jgi:TonB family protein
MTPHALTGSGSSGHGRRQRRGLFEDFGALGAVALALLLNVALFAIILGGVGLPNHGVTHRDEVTEMLPAREVAALDPSCDGDAFLRAAAQAAMCLTPLADDVDACLDQTQARLDSEIFLCHVDRIEVTPELALVDAQTMPTTSAIDAEPLLEPLTPDEIKQFEAQLAATAPDQPPPPPPQPTQQVIEAPKPVKEEVADNARYLSDYDSKVDKQSAKHENKYEEMVARPEPEELAAKKAPKEATAPEPEAPKDPGKQDDAPPLPGALSMRAPGAPDRADTEQEQKIAGATDGATGPEGDGAQKRGDGSVSQDERHPVETAKGAGGAGGGTPRTPNLRPDDETLERLVGGGSVDDLKDVDEGDENAFNTKRWVYASFFNRMKRVVAQNWDPISVWHAEDPDGSHYGFKNRNTTLRVSLDGKGGVQKIVISGPCGVDSLDDEAIRAFKQSGPFPNPPQALIDSKGLITFEFGFSFTINEKSTSWKIYRSI